jgi:dTDP-4-dehydrorhamnose reductase
LVKRYSFEKIFLAKKSSLKKFSHVINTSIHPNYIKKKYNKKYDLDRKFLNKFSSIDFIYVFLNTRKIYQAKYNISEKSLIKPRDQYAKNKYITENFLKQNFDKKLLSLRISNIIGNRIYLNNRNNHKLFFDNFLNLRKKKKKIIIKNDYKDFISIDQFSDVIEKICQKKLTGIFNVSLSKKIFVSEIVRWLDKNFYKKVRFVRSKDQSFTLSNKKLLSEISVKLLKKDIKLFCKNLIKNNNN